MPEITNEKEYEIALARLKEIFHADIGTPEGIECQYLSNIIFQYEEKEWPINYDHADAYFYEDINNNDNS